MTTNETSGIRILWFSSFLQRLRFSPRLRASLSMYILTYNEEFDIAACIKSALLSDDVIMVDSYTSERTLNIVSNYPLLIVQHFFESYH